MKIVRLIAIIAIVIGAIIAIVMMTSKTGAAPPARKNGKAGVLLAEPAISAADGKWHDPCGGLRHSRLEAQDRVPLPGPSRDLCC
jgi:hypothetical protein